MAYVHSTCFTLLLGGNFTLAALAVSFFFSQIEVCPLSALCVRENVCMGYLLQECARI